MKPLLAFALFLAISVPALANEPPRKINFLTALANVDGKPMTECEKADDANPQKCIVTTDLTLGKLAMRALTIQYSNESPLSGEDQVLRSILAQEIYKNGEAVLTSKDTDLLCTSIAKLVNKAGYTTWVTYQAWQLLDPAGVQKK